MLELSKIIPEHTETVLFTWIVLDHQEMSPLYRKARRGLKSPMDSCFWCNHSFIDGEMISLGGRYGKENVVLCRNCAMEARKNA